MVENRNADIDAAIAACDFDQPSSASGKSRAEGLEAVCQSF